MPADPAPRSTGRQVPLPVVALGAVVLAAVVVFLAVGSFSTKRASTPAGRPSTTTRSATGSATGGACLPADRPPPASTLIATTHGGVAAYAEPAGAPTGLVPASWHGGVSGLPVIDQRPGWVDVRLAQRPNGATAWLRAADVTLTTTTDRIVVDLTHRRLCLYSGGRLQLVAPAGIGTAAAPTVTGRYFVALLAKSASPGYGPFVMVTSAHSDTVTDWEQSGDALIAIHGPLGSDAAIGTTGAAVSHGCIRLHLADQARLRRVPVGSPVDITS